MTTAYSPQDALIALMVAVSAADADIGTVELLTIDQMVQALPVFQGYDPDRIKNVSRSVFDLLEEEDGLDALIGMVKEALPERLYETAYALACDVAAADGKLNENELRLLQMLRYDLPVPRLIAAAIEQGARARHLSL